MKNKQLVFLFTLFIFFAALFYPRYYLISDEHHYARTAYLLAVQGTSTISDVLHAGIFHLQKSGTFSSKYPLGFPLLLAPFMKLGFDYIFLANILLHITAAYCFYQLIRKKISPWYTALYLFMPFFAYYSFSLFSDYTAATLIVIFLCIRESQKKWIGYALGTIAVALLYIRPIALLFFVPLFMHALITFWKTKNIKTIKTELNALAVFLPFLVFFLIFSFGKVFGGYLSTDIESLFIYDNPSPILSFFSHAWYQIELLLLVYPLMALVLFKHWKKPAIQGAMLYMLFFCFIDYTYNVTRFVSIFSLTRHVRYLLPVIATLLPQYCFELDNLLKKTFKKYKPLALGVLIFLLILSTASLLALHHAATTRNRAMMEDIYAATPENSLIIGNTLAYLMHDSFGNRLYAGIDDYGETVNSTFYQSLAGHNTSLTYLSDLANTHTTTVVELHGKYINDFPDTQQKIATLITTHNGTLLYTKNYGCSWCKGVVDTLNVSVYRLQ